MLNFLQPYLLWIKIALTVVIIGFIIREWNSFVDGQQRIGYDRAVSEYSKKLEKEKETALELERNWNRKWELATEERTNVENQLSLAFERSSDSEHRLQLATKIFNKRILEVTSETCATAAISVSDILGECVTRYRELAKKADEHVADERLCLSSWPE